MDFFLFNMTTNIAVRKHYLTCVGWLFFLFVLVSDVFNLLPNVNLSTSGTKECSIEGKKGSFANETFDCKEGLNIDVNTARPHSVHSFNNCSGMGVIIPSVNLRDVRSDVKAWLAEKVCVWESDMWVTQHRVETMFNHWCNSWYWHHRGQSL